jgi:hypothetical protein
MPIKSVLLLVVFLCWPVVLLGQDRVVIVRHGSTPEGDIIRARADAILLLKHAELTGEKAYAQRLENLIRECDVVYKRFSTRNKIQKEALENKFDRTFDIIRFNQQLADIRGELEQTAIIQHSRVGDLTDEMNSLLEAFTRQSFKAADIPAMKTELSPEQIDALFLTDGSNTFSGKTGKTRLEAFKWPFMIQRKEFQQERNDFDVSCDQAVKEVNENGSPSPETIGDLLKQLDAIDKGLDALPLSDSLNVRVVETKWRKEAKSFIRDLTRTLGNCSRLDSEKLSKCVFTGKTLGELLDHLNKYGLRFSHPSEQDENLYASIFFVIRYASQECGKSAGDAPDSTQRMEKETNNGFARCLPAGAILAFAFEKKDFTRQGDRIFLKDLSGNGHQGEVSGTQEVEGRVGTALLFGGKNDYVECKSVPSLNPTKAITICLWIKARSWQSTATDYLVSKDDWEQKGTNGYVLRCRNNGQLNFTIGNSTWYDALSSDRLDTGRWYHVASSYDGNTIRVFVDGVEKGSSSVNRTILPSSYNLRIGRGHFAPDRCFDGVIDEIVIFGRALTTKEVQSVYRLGLQ